MPGSLSLFPDKPKARLVLLAWVFLVLFAGKFILNDALPYFGLDEGVFGRFWIMKWPLVGHISGGLIALIVGPFQFWDGFRNRYLKIHRWMGRLYLTGILIASVSSVALAFSTSIAIHWTWAVALLALAMAWFFTSGMALRMILLKRLQQHKEWMIRSYVVTFGFVIFRWLSEMEWITSQGTFVEYGPTIGWLSWVIPLFFTDILLNWNKK